MSKIRNCTDTAKERRKLAEYFVRQIEKKFTPLPPVTRQLVIQAFETGHKAGQMEVANA